MKAKEDLPYYFEEARDCEMVEGTLIYIQPEATRKV